jgi:hypothetical protein
VKPAEFSIEVFDTGDPLERTTGTTRPAEYRLKLLLKHLLRAHGFRATKVAPLKPENPNSNEEPHDGPA